jgi:hypothetical protein
MKDSRDALMDLMRERGIEVTRENYITMAWGKPIPEWTSELESELPEELQNWALFEVKNNEVVLKKD